MATTQQVKGNRQASTKSDEEAPLSKREPSAPFALVGLAYMTILALVAMTLGAVYYFVM